MEVWKRRQRSDPPRKKCGQSRINWLGKPEIPGQVFHWRSKVFLDGPTSAKLENVRTKKTSAVLSDQNHARVDKVSLISPIGEVGRAIGRDLRLQIVVRGRTNNIFRHRHRLIFTGRSSNTTRVTTFVISMDVSQPAGHRETIVLTQIWMRSAIKTRHPEWNQPLKNASLDITLRSRIILPRS